MCDLQYTHSCLTESERSVCSTVACRPKSAMFTLYFEQSPARNRNRNMMLSADIKVSTQPSPQFSQHTSSSCLYRFAYSLVSTQSRMLYIRGLSEYATSFSWHLSHVADQKYGIGHR